MMNNTRLVTIQTVDADHMVLTLYYGRRQVDKAMMGGVLTSSHQDLVDCIEQFRLYGVGDDNGSN